MRFEIILAPEAVDDFLSLRANIRSTVRDALETHLRYDPRENEPEPDQAVAGIGATAASTSCWPDSNILRRIS